MSGLYQHRQPTNDGEDSLAKIGLGSAILLFEVGFTQQICQYLINAGLILQPILQ